MKKKLPPFNILLLLLLCVFNLMYMHYYIIATCDLEAEMDITSVFDNFLGIVGDTLFLFLFFTAITWGNIKRSILLCFATTEIWAFCNILYSRFFFRYISFSAIGQATNLFDWFMIECMINEIKPYDVIFLIMPLIFCMLYKKCTSSLRLNRIDIRNTGILFLFFLLLDFSVHCLYCVYNPALRYLYYYTYRLHFTHIDTSRNMGRPNWTNYHRGSIRTIVADIATNVQGDINLSTEQKKIITDYITNDTLRITNNNSNNNLKNIIFILVESYTAFTTDMVIEGKEVTPFLNQLRKDSTVYYNGNMKSNITIGQSSDGQFIYMTGLLPLRSNITVSRTKTNVMPALPKLFKQAFPNMESRMVIPTLPTLWEQDEMCQAYGFDHLYSSNDFKGEHNRNLTDEEVFQLAERYDKNAHRPFFSCIITMSMHGPYNSIIDPSFNIQNKKYCQELNNFLNVCHYTDRQIEKYITHLKECGLYDNSLIIIAPDHQVPENTVDVEQYGLTRELPLFIVNGKINNKEAWTGDCNQIDVYTTILDILNINTPWKGLGNSLLCPNFKNSLSPTSWDISEWIISSNYFKSNISFAN